MSLYSTKFDQFYRFIGAGKLLSGFFYRFISDKNFGEPNCIALFDFFSKIVYLYRFKQYIFEYRCPPLIQTIAGLKIIISLIVTFTR